MGAGRWRVGAGVYLMPPSPAAAPTMTNPPRPSRETAAALAARAQAITAEANDLLAGAMREAIDAAGGLSDVAVETARDVAQYLVRRGRMARDEAERLLAAAEDAAARRVAARRVAAGRVPPRPADAGPSTGSPRNTAARKAGAKRAATKPAAPGTAGAPTAEAAPAPSTRGATRKARKPPEPA